MDSAQTLKVLERLETGATHVNGLNNCTVVGLSWGNFTPAMLALAPCDLILGADVLYESTVWEDLVATVV
jgi:hypothetical protein